MQQLIDNLIHGETKTLIWTHPRPTRITGHRLNSAAVLKTFQLGIFVKLSFLPADNSQNYSLNIHAIASFHVAISILQLSGVR